MTTGRLLTFSNGNFNSSLSESNTTSTQKLTYQGRHLLQQLRHPTLGYFGSWFHLPTYPGRQWWWLNSCVLATHVGHVDSLQLLASAVRLLHTSGEWSNQWGNSLAHSLTHSLCFSKKKNNDITDLKSMINRADLTGIYRTALLRPFMHMIFKHTEKYTKTGFIENHKTSLNTF